MQQEEQKNSCAIKRITVKKLFGLYDYELPPKKEDRDIEKIFILYGDNGCGKSAILNLVFHLITPDDSAEHKRFVAQTKFQFVKVEFTNGYCVWAKRENDFLTGMFEIGIEENKQLINKFRCVTITDAHDELPTYTHRGDNQAYNFFSRLKKLNLSLYLLPDDRKIQITPSIMPPLSFSDKAGEEFFCDSSDEVSPSGVMRRKNRTIKSERTIDFLLERSIEQTINKNLIDNLIKIINSFFHNKFISFDINSGLEIRLTANNNEKLTPNMLSSGEKHLLLLFLTAISASEKPSIFIIDEPEISLNIKWQRKLISSLLKCAGNNLVQYIIATHSIQTLVNHPDQVVKLAQV